MSQGPLSRDLKLIEKEFGADLAPDMKGDLQTIDDDLNLGQAIFNRLRTKKGEYKDLGHSLYGSRLFELVGQPNNERTRNLTRQYVREALSQDARIREIQGIVLSVSHDQPNRIDIAISVTPVGKDTVLSIVFPLNLEVE